MPFTEYGYYSSTTATEFGDPVVTSGLTHYGSYILAYGLVQALSGVVDLEIDNIGITTQDMALSANDIIEFNNDSVIIVDAAILGNINLDFLLSGIIIQDMAIHGYTAPEFRSEPKISREMAGFGSGEIEFNNEGLIYIDRTLSNDISIDFNLPDTLFTVNMSVNSPIITEFNNTNSIEVEQSLNTDIEFDFNIPDNLSAEVAIGGVSNFEIDNKGVLRLSYKGAPTVEMDLEDVYQLVFDIEEE